MIINQFLPVNKEDMANLGWEKLDFIIVSGDAYVDHPSFGHAVISRVLVDAGFKVGIIAQPDWKDVEAFKVLGRPKYGFIISPGNIDSMVNHYSVSKKRRRVDSFAPGGKMGLRPDRCVIVYANMIRRAYKKIKIIIGGIEASLRRFAHYDYWQDKVRRSILFDSEADILIYGMGEKQIVEIADYMKSGIDLAYIHHIPGTCYLTDSLENVMDYREVPSYEEVAEDKKIYAKAFKVLYEEQDPIRGKTIVQKHKNQYLVQNPPMMPLTREEFDRVYSLSYQKNYHPMYEALGGVPAIREVKHSIISERGCFGSCSFCALTFHQGRMITSRSHESILEEAKGITEMDDFKGYINDVGGPTANFRNVSCKKQLKFGTCKHRQCLYPEPCEHLEVDHEDLIELLRKIRELEKIKKVFLRSGLRYDYMMADNNPTFFKELCQHHVSGQLKVAPEHIDQEVLKYMQKPGGPIYKAFVKKFYDINKEIGKEQYIVPYLMSSHPGSTIRSAIVLAEYLRDIKYTPEQVQDFYPTPGTLSTCMYHTGLDPRTMKPVYVPKSFKEKKMQRALLQYKNPKNYDLVVEALKLEGREDLIGNGKQCLVKERNAYQGRGKRPSSHTKDKRKQGKPKRRRK
ncbi:YgiQ family radical SAM protein [Acidaminobacter sp. JC074]|uniref:YgiQ family radical SAM protein n=1 Tax=Acidaminobacter sp. JC074 TaxID=2530199 RepID=UPI001F1128A7|nr:YgiQ family radical SAM protein [Acidaminobacter sp. JC074]MCH4890744.1 YgiQ family radical SAM protein [Acidaminobacter sp. JC074]